MKDDPDNDTQDEMDLLAAEYVLGTLAAGPRAEIEQRLDHDPALQAAVDTWEQRLLPLTELAAPTPPPASVWPRIVDSVGGLQPVERINWWDRLALWRGLTALAVSACLVLGVLLLRAPPVSAPTYLVVLVAPQSNAPGWVIQAGERQNMQLIPLGVVEVPLDKSLQFWTKGERWQAPVSLGLVKPGQTLQIPLDKLPPLEPNQLFELTLEGRGGSPTGKPTGPIQFIGRAVKVI
ncbi:anti-sigma factor [Pseudomonas alkylphenolica]|uniref:anti-sigma factor n=1 Tax=Pseudomonas alkylphenolica TaxID=237609 RepID=UPI0018D9A658|nr:anti-sigma factor [Pseudomonas alkylphenolica]MBH3428165.1 anti-sigma factor [Pseudomonas alkylphenolica]